MSREQVGLAETLRPFDLGLEKTKLHYPWFWANYSQSTIGMNTCEVVWILSSAVAMNIKRKESYLMTNKAEVFES